jgi:hypothetical protein
VNRKLWLLNFALLALAVAAGSQLRGRWLADHARSKAKLRVPLAKVAAPPFTPAPEPPAVLPANYINVAQKDLFDPSRNPDVPVEAPPPPPPPPPMPPLPVYHGAMNIGDGPVAIMSVTASGKHEAIKPGEMIGPFKLVDLTRTDLTLEWNGQTVRKELWELQNRTLPAEVAAAQHSDNPGLKPPAPKPAARQESKGPGDITNFGTRICQPGDTDAVGTVKDGFKKVSIATPFGNACSWDPVGK